MSTLATADLNSDSEGDEDFVPSAPKSKKTANSKRKRSSSTNSDSSNDHDVKVDKQEAEELKEEERKVEEERRKAKAAEAFALLKGEPSGQEPVEADGKEPYKEMVEIKRARNFAGETIQ